MKASKKVPAMNYKKHYSNLIYRAQNREFQNSGENHIVNSWCYGQSSDQEVSVRLTTKEKFVACQLLTKIYPNKKRFVFELRQLIQGRPKDSPVKFYSWIKNKIKKFSNEEITQDQEYYWYHDPETKEEEKLLLEDVPKGWSSGKIETSGAKYCQICDVFLGTKTKAKYCNSCRKSKSKNKSQKIEKQTNIEEIDSSVDSESELFFGLYYPNR